MRRVIALGAIAAWAGVACTLLSPLDYLTEGGPLVDGGPDSPGDDAEGGVTPPPPPATTVASGQGSPDFVAVDAEAVYWHVGRAEGGGGAIVAMPIAGGTARTIAQTAITIGQLAVDADPNGFVYWSDGALIRRAKKQSADGGSDVVATGLYPIAGFALDGTTIFTAESDAVNATSAVARVDPDGGRVVLTDQDSPTAITIAGPNVWWAATTPDNEAHGLPRTTTNDAGTIVVLGKNEFDPATQQELSGDDQQLYWTDPSSINRHNLLPNAPTTVLFTDQDGSASYGDVSVDSKYVWFTDETNGTVLRLPKAGGAATPETRASGYDTLRGIVSDGTSVWFVAQGSGTSDGKVLRIPAP